VTTQEIKNPFYKNQNGIVQGAPKSRSKSPLKQLNRNQFYAASQPNLPPSTFMKSKNIHMNKNIYNGSTGRMSQGVNQGQAQKFYGRISH